MARAYQDLLSTDPAFPGLQQAAHDAKNGVRILEPRDGGARRATLEGLQITTRSGLGALAHETGGVLIDHGWLRHLGAGCDRLPRTLGGWNATLEIPLLDYLIVADDIVGGAFAVNGGALGEAIGNVY